VARYNVLKEVKGQMVTAVISFTGEGEVIHLLLLR